MNETKFSCHSNVGSTGQNFERKTSCEREGAIAGLQRCVSFLIVFIDWLLIYRCWGFCLDSKGIVVVVLVGIAPVVQVVFIDLAIGIRVVSGLGLSHVFDRYPIKTSVVLFLSIFTASDFYLQCYRCRFRLYFDPSPPKKQPLSRKRRYAKVYIRIPLIIGSL